MSNEIVEQKAKRNEKKIEASLYYERMNRNQRKTRVVNIMRKQFYIMKTKIVHSNYLPLYGTKHTHTHQHEHHHQNNFKTHSFWLKNDCICSRI